ncbi:hypothetical protein B0H14DRAFT_2642378 [Mycena olivaceomarginata]|nr:hypothetical protein B0H14DRAFT_2642378 [Mycena olivaceomarginata]
MNLKDDAAKRLSLCASSTGTPSHTRPSSISSLSAPADPPPPTRTPHSSPFAHHPHPADDADDPNTAPPSAHPPFLVHLCAPPCGLPLGRLTLPRVVHRAAAIAQGAPALGRIGRTVEWVLWNGNGSVEEGGVDVEGQSPVHSRKGNREEQGQRERGRGRQSPKTTSTDGYGSDDEDPDDGGAISDGNSNSSERGGGSVRNEKEWGWGDGRPAVPAARRRRRAHPRDHCYCVPLHDEYMFYS